MCNHKPPLLRGATLSLMDGGTWSVAWRVALGLCGLVGPARRGTRGDIFVGPPPTHPEIVAVICKLQERQCPARIRHITKSCTHHSGALGRQLCKERETQQHHWNCSQELSMVAMQSFINKAHTLCGIAVALSELNLTTTAQGSWRNACSSVHFHGNFNLLF